nr:hypothetical protein [Tanacetum cinerariifolium]
MTSVATEFTMREILEKAMTYPNSKLTETWINLDELCKKILNDLQCNTFSGMEEKDVVDHIANLEMLDPIKIEIFDTNQLRMDIFPFSLLPKLRYGGLVKNIIKSPLRECLSKVFSTNTFPYPVMENAILKTTGIDDIASSNEECEESGYENPPNTIGDSLLEPNTKQYENGFNTQKVPSSSNMNDTLPNGKRCMVENFETLYTAYRTPLDTAYRRVWTL